MRFVYSPFNIELCLTEGIPQVCIIEKSEIFTLVMEDLWMQMNGDMGKLIISDNDKVLRMDKMVELIWNPFDISCNNRKVLSNIYSELNKVANDSYIQEMSLINEAAIQLFDMITRDSCYPYTYDIDLDLMGIMKLYNLKLEEKYVNILDKIVSYIKIMHQICGKELFIFVNLKHYLSDSQLELFYKECLYEHIFLLDIEGGQGDRKRLDVEKYCVLDKDLCIIRY